MKKIILSLAISLAATSLSLACTSVIVSGKATADGRPVMLKHRDTDCLDNRIDRYQGPRYAFIGLVNAPKNGGEVWSGTNEAGFCIMNTASYNIKNDKISYNKMDKEGVLMYEALGTCATVEDFRNFLKNHKKPLLVEANFGIIDAQGGASYFEVNNYEWWEYNVNELPEGYKVQTNYSFAGRWDEAMGVERYQTASAIMNEYASTHAVGTFELKHDFFVNHFSRSYRHEVLGTTEDFCPESGVTVDQDFIPRRITSAAIVFEGVKPGEDPHKTVMWTALGYPATAVMFPLLVGETNILPTYIQRNGKNGHCMAADLSNGIKNKYIFPDRVSNGKRYLHIGAVQKGVDGRSPLKSCAVIAEEKINEGFYTLYNEWIKGICNDEKFYDVYQQIQPGFWKIYTEAYQEYPINE